MDSRHSTFAIHGFLNSLDEAYSRFISEDLLGIFDIGKRMSNVSGTGGRKFRFDSNTQNPFDGLEQLKNAGAVPTRDVKSPAGRAFGHAGK
jgi:hypothetical protein